MGEGGTFNKYSIVLFNHKHLLHFLFTRQKKTTEAKWQKYQKNNANPIHPFFFQIIRFRFLFLWFGLYVPCVCVCVCVCVRESVCVCVFFIIRPISWCFRLIERGWVTVSSFALVFFRFFAWFFIFFPFYCMHRSSSINWCDGIERKHWPRRNNEFVCFFSLIRFSHWCDGRRNDVTRDNFSLSLSLSLLVVSFSAMATINWCFLEFFSEKQLDSAVAPLGAPFRFFFVSLRLSVLYRFSRFSSLVPLCSLACTSGWWTAPLTRFG